MPKKRSNFILCGKSLQLLAKIARLDLERHWDKRRWRIQRAREDASDCYSNSRFLIKPRGKIR